MCASTFEQYFRCSIVTVIQLPNQPVSQYQFKVPSTIVDDSYQL